jgi:hypothetical protein
MLGHVNTHKSERTRRRRLLMPTHGRARAPNAPQGLQRGCLEDDANGRLGEAALPVMALPVVR